MNAQMPVSRTQMWLARGAIFICIVMLVMVVVLKSLGFGSVNMVQSKGTTTYTAAPVASVLFGVLGLVTCVLTVVHWLQPGRIFRVFSAILLLLGAFILFNAPTGVNHHLTVTPNSFEMRIGAWYAPIVYHVDLANVQFLQVTEAASDEKGRKRFELQCFTKPNGDKLIIPINDFMKMGLSEIFRRAVAHGVVIGEDAEGWQIPPELTSE